MAVFLIEPVQGEGEFISAPPEFLRKLRVIADEKGFLLLSCGVNGNVIRLLPLLTNTK